MTQNRRQVLEMLSTGKITADEADRLIAALGESPDAGAGSGTPRPGSFKYLRVLVDAEEQKDGPVRVNVRVPIQLLRAGVRLASLIPPQAQERVNEALHDKGMAVDLSQLKPENLDELIDHLQDLTVDVDQKNENIRVKVFCE